MVFGGGGKGSMGSLANGFILSMNAFPERGASLIGVMPEKLARPELQHPHSSIRTVATMEERKRIFWQECDAYLCLPGGIGTMDELWEAACMVKLGFIPQRPIVVLDSDGFFTPLRQALTDMVQAGYMDQGRAGLITFVTDIPTALHELGVS